MHGETKVLKDPDAVAEAAAAHLLGLMQAQPGERFSLALSGGSTPGKFYRLLTQPQWRERIDWGLLHLFLADERFLPWDHPDSNYRMIRELLADQVPIPAENLHPMPVEGDPADCARHYEAELKRFFGASSPSLDLVVLGMGPDGHTASLFPGHVHRKGQWVVPVQDSPKPPPTRLSLGLEFINQARHLLFLVTGKDKSAALAHIREARQPMLPAGQVALAGEGMVWLLDEAAWESGVP
jgi:6-phosphogluconolactonase